MLTSDHASFGDAAEGPLEEGNLGVVVGVDHLPDTQGGLEPQHRRYCVRASHNGLLHRCVWLCVCVWGGVFVPLCVGQHIGCMCV